MSASDIKTHDTSAFMERHAERDARIESNLRDNEGRFFAIPVQEMLRLSKLPVPPVRSTGHTLIWLTHGEANMKVGYEACRAVAGECLFVAAGKVFSYDRLEDNEGFLLHWEDGFIAAELGQSPLQTFDFLNVWGNAVIHPDSQATDLITGLCGRLLGIFQAAPKDETRLKAHLISLLHELAHADGPATSQPSPAAVALTKRFKALLYQNCRSLHQVAEYADRLAVSPNHLNKAVKQITGKSPSRWIDEAIVLEAKVLLLQTQLNIGEVAAEVGVTDASYFSRLFRKFTGITPAQYRSRIDLS
ncbi:MAG: helix-turn-helix transcriptional regulator [Bacteroidia bacterium]